MMRTFLSGRYLYLSAWTVGVTALGFAAGELVGGQLQGGLLGAGLALTGSMTALTVAAHLQTINQDDFPAAPPPDRDELTGLANRTHLYEKVTASLEADQERRSVLLLIDLDRFKDVNDSLGHAAGDELLRQVAVRIRQALRDGDLIARLGGDEFAIYLEGIPDEDTATRMAAKIRGALDAPFTIQDILLDVEASIGIAHAPAHGTDIHRLMQRADVAMYAAKRSKAGFEIYDPRRDPNSADRLSMVADLRRAVDHDEFHLEYQPKAMLGDGRVESVEALLRWVHPERGLIPPAVFIPIAEQIGLMKPITMFVIDAALQQARSWREQGVGLKISVNISAQDLHDVRLTEDIAHLLHKWGAEPDWLRIEITESAVMVDPDSAINRLSGLAEMGLELSMDDYGTGNTSLTYLKQMPLTELKIDRSFVQNITADRRDALIVGSTVELGHGLGLRVVAEGVEREEDWIGLQLLGCDMAQGYFIARPMPPAGLIGWLEEVGRDYVRIPPEQRPAPLPGKTSVQ